MVSRTVLLVVLVMAITHEVYGGLRIRTPSNAGDSEPKKQADSEPKKQPDSEPKAQSKEVGERGNLIRHLREKIAMAEDGATKQKLRSQLEFVYKLPSDQHDEHQIRKLLEKINSDQGSEQDHQSLVEDLAKYIQSSSRRQRVFGGGPKRKPPVKARPAVYHPEEFAKQRKIFQDELEKGGAGELNARHKLIHLSQKAEKSVKELETHHHIERKAGKNSVSADELQKELEHLELLKNDLKEVSEIIRQSENVHKAKVQVKNDAKSELAKAEAKARYEENKIKAAETKAIIEAKTKARHEENERAKEAKYKAEAEAKA